MKRGTNASLMKEHNRKLILNLIRRKPCSRAEVAKHIGLTKASVTILVDELLKDGFLTEAESDYRGVGRRPIILQLQPDAGYAIGVSISRRFWRVGLTNLNGRLLCVTAGTVQTEARRQIRQIATEIERMLASVDNRRILGIGVAVPGPVDYRKGIILTPPNFSAWHHYPVAAQLSEMTGYPVWLENISNASALAEGYFGTCVGEENYCYLIVNEGIGSGLVSGGKIYRGENGYGNELGHTSIDWRGRICECGNIGCLEKYASIPALLDGTELESWQEVIDGRFRTLMEQQADYLACALINLIHLFDLTKIILGGDLQYGASVFAPILSERVNARLLTGSRAEICGAAELDSAVQAAAIALNTLFAN